MIETIKKIGTGVGVVVGLVGLGLGAKKGNELIVKHSRLKLNFPDFKVRRDEIFFLTALASSAMNIKSDHDDEVDSLLLFLEKYYLKKFRKEQSVLIKIYKSTHTLTQLKEYYDAINPQDKRNNEYLNFLFGCLTFNNKNTTIDKVLYLKVYMLLNQNWNGKIYLIPDEREVRELTDYANNLVVPSKKTKLLLDFPNTEFNDYSNVYFEHPDNKSALLSVDEILDENFIYEKDIEILEAMRLCGAKKVVLKLSTITDKSSSLKVKENSKSKEAENTDENKKNEITVEEKNTLSADLINSQNIDEEYSVKFTGGRDTNKRRALFLSKSRWLNNDEQIKWLFDSCAQKSRPETFNYTTKYNKVTKLSTAVSVFSNFKKLNFLNSSLDQNIEAKISSLTNTKRIYQIEF